MQKPNFIERDPGKVVSEMVARYEQLVGKALQPAQIERLLTNDWAYRESLLREGIQYTGEQNLVRFANAPMLDYLGELLGVKRLVPLSAETTLQFSFIPSNPGGVIPAGTRVQTSDGKAVFSTAESVIITAGATTANVAAACDTPGSLGNGYLVGQVNTLLDPQPIISSGSNIVTTAGGSDAENDEQLRERIMLAPASFSNAGSRGAYIFWAKSANPDIIDVSVMSPTPGEVEVYVLMANGNTTPPQVIGQVNAAVNDDRIRPLTDGVTVLAASAVNYNISVNLTLLSGSVEPDVLAAVDAAVNALILAKRQRLGRDVTSSEVISAAQVPGVYKATLADWTDVIVSDSQYAKIGTYARTVIGTNNG